MREEIYLGRKMPSVDLYAVELDGESGCLLSYLANKMLMILIQRWKLVMVLARQLTD